jgi:hypothetical protein
MDETGLGLYLIVVLVLTVLLQSVIIMSLGTAVIRELPDECRTPTR